jgi:polyene glycosyltransferase
VTILFSSPAHPGQLNPLRTVAKEIARRGTHEVWFASEDTAADQIAPLPFLSLGPTRLKVTDELYAAMARPPLSTEGIVALALSARRADTLHAGYEATLAQIEQLHPALIVADVFAIGALDAALATGTPFAVSVPYPLSSAYLSRLPWSYPTPMSGFGHRPPWLRNAAFRIRVQAALGRALVPRMARQRRGFANRFADPEQYCAAAAAVLGYSVFGLEYPFPVADHVHMVGAAIPPQPPDDPLSGWLDERPSVVYVGLGTLARLSAAQLRALLEALTRLAPQHHVLWKLPAAQRALLPEHLPEHIRAEPWIPSQTAVLAHPHTSAFVTHGGANGFHEALHYARPMLLMPFWMDCYDIAARGVDAGVGLALDRPHHLHADEIHAKLCRILTESSFRARAAHWSERLRAGGGAPRAADILTELADHAKAPTRSRPE